MKGIKIGKRWNLAWLLTLVLLGTQVPVSVQAHSNSAPLQYSPPSGYGLFTYVPEYWQTSNTFNGQTRSLAYQKGYQVYFTASSPNIVLDFGRQVLAPSGNWGIYTIPETAKHSMLWVHNIMQDFMDGYNDNSAHQNHQAFIAAATNNGDYNWNCDDADPSTLASLWYIAGDQWGQLLNGLTPRTWVTKKSADDFESWYGTPQFGIWTACGAGAHSWFQGYENQTYTGNYNFGDNTHDSYSPQWTTLETYNTVYGEAVAYGLPQVYCSGYHWDQSWVPIRNNYSFYLLGVSSTNGGQGPGNCDNLNYLTSWNNLNNALTNAGYPNTVQSNVLAWWQNP